MNRGSVEQLPSGKFRVRLRDGRGIRRQIGPLFDSLEEAQIVKVSVAEEVADEPTSEAATLKEYGDKVLKRREAAGVVRDTASNRSNWDRHIRRDPIARMALHNVRRCHVIAWLRRIERKGLAQQTVSNVLNVLRVIYREAFDDEIVKVNPCAKVKVTTIKRTHLPWTYLTPPEQEALLKAVPSPERHIVEFAMWTGLRAGEVCSLRLEDVRMDGEFPFVTVRYGTPPKEPTKTGSIREVPLFPRAMKALEAFAEKRSEFNPHGLAFPRVRGGYRDPNHVILGTIWVKAKKDAKLTRRVRWHDLRHTCASSLVSGWRGRPWTLHEVKELLGHSTITITERYAHLADTALKRAAKEAKTWPTLAHGKEEKEEESSMISMAPPVRIGRTTFGLGNPPLTAENIEENAKFDSRGPGVGQGSIALLEAMAAGDTLRASEIAHALALAVVESPAVAAARAVLAGGALAPSRACELAGLLMEMESPSDRAARRAR